MSKNLRLIGGSHAGETFAVDEHVPVLRLPVMDNCSFPKWAPADEPVPECVVEIERYVVQPMDFGTGHAHHYGVCEPMRLVDAMNVMWDAYSAKARKEQKR